MENKQVPFEIRYRIIKIHTIKFTFEDISEDVIDNLFKVPDGLVMIINTSLKIDKDKSIINVDIGTVLIDKEQGKNLIEHTGRTSYEIIGLDKIYNKDNEAFDVPNDLTIQLYSLAYTHTRALLAVEISPTIYKDKYFLPVVDMTKLLESKLNKATPKEPKIVE